MSKIFFTITGTSFKYGHSFIEPGTTVTLRNDIDNMYDSEAIATELKGLGKIGYVANSTHTIIGMSWSAGRIYDKIGDTATGTVLYKMPQGLLCALDGIDFPETKDEVAVNEK